MNQSKIKKNFLVPFNYFETKNLKSGRRRVRRLLKREFLCILTSHDQTLAEKDIFTCLRVFTCFNGGQKKKKRSNNSSLKAVVGVSDDWWKPRGFGFVSSLGVLCHACFGQRLAFRCFLGQFRRLKLHDRYSDP